MCACRWSRKGEMMSHAASQCTQNTKLGKHYFFKNTQSHISSPSPPPPGTFFSPYKWKTIAQVTRGWVFFRVKCLFLAGCRCEICVPTQRFAWVGVGYDRPWIFDAEPFCHLSFTVCLSLLFFVFCPPSQRRICLLSLHLLSSAT